jgi:hypothetical protein
MGFAEWLSYPHIMTECENQRIVYVKNRNRFR